VPKRPSSDDESPLAAVRFLRSIRLERERVPSFDEYPFSIPAIKALDDIPLDPRVTFFVGDNGSGKSTLIEAIAILAGFNAEGGTNNFAFSTRSSESPLRKYMRVARGPRRPRSQFFLRAESYFNVATEIERIDREHPDLVPLIELYGGVSLHEQSHGESFLALLNHKFRAHGLYILDEPEAALSPQRQLSMLARMHTLVNEGAQFLIATHSPLLMAFPGALIYQLSQNGIEPIAFEDTEHFQITRDFLNNRERYFKHLFSE
jgi:predicted ATPase